MSWHKKIALSALVLTGCGRVEVVPTGKFEHVIERQGEIPNAFKRTHDAFGLASIRDIKEEVYSLAFSSDVYDVVFRLLIDGDKGNVVKSWRFRPDGAMHKQTAAVEAMSIKEFREVVMGLSHDVSTTNAAVTPGGIMFYFEIKNGDYYRTVSSSSAQDTNGRYNKIFDWFDHQIAPN